MSKSIGKEKANVSLIFSDSLKWVINPIKISIKMTTDGCPSVCLFDDKADDKEKAATPLK